MSTPARSAPEEKSSDLPSTVLAQLLALGPEAQGEQDESLLLANLALTPLQRLEAMSQAATQIEMLRQAVNNASARHG